MTKTQIVEALVEGGKATAGPPLGSSLGPLKVNIGQVVAEINNKTKDFKGMKVPVKIEVNLETKGFTITIGTPPATQLIKNEIGLKKGSGDPSKTKYGVISIEHVIKVAKMKMDSLLVHDLKAAVKTIIGSCQSAGILVDGKEPREILKEIDEGKYDAVIKSGKTEPDANKKAELDKLAIEIKAKVEEVEKKKAEAKAQAADAAPKEAKPATASPAAAKPAVPTKKK